MFIGVSAPNVLDGDDVTNMAPGAIVFALANPDPEVDPDEARQYAAVVATGRSDYPNQINNVLAFPGVFRGLLDAQATTITEAMLVAAARALADVVPAEELGPDYIIPSVFHPDVASGVAAAVRDAALAEGRQRRRGELILAKVKNRHRWMTPVMPPTCRMMDTWITRVRIRRLAGCSSRPRFSGIRTSSAPWCSSWSTRTYRALSASC